ncbi:MFS general substrate transporter [Roridomyces roridus]|uniref:MFS general substrate transporter n=1 Tax=Roridomyces roridus TaxID=1738132 RepID=A0AAD7G1N7_9AGAR|nr:MFS general substrate transporter [Roridomyces roridus]
MPTTSQNSTLDEKPLSARQGDNVPDGGFQAWATVAGSFLLMFCGLGYSTSFGVYQDFYVREYLLHSSPSAISWIGSINLVIIFAGGIIAGRLHDRGYFYPLIYCGSLLMSISLFCLSLARANQFYQVLLAQGIANGIGTAMTYVPSIAVISHHFEKRRALAMILVSSGASLGSVFHPLMLNKMLQNPRLGFGHATRINAGLISGLLLLACCLMRTRLPPPAKHLPWIPTLRRFVHDAPYVFAAAGWGFLNIGLYYPLFYLQLDSTKHGIDPMFSFYVLVITNASSFVGRLCPTLVSRRWGIQIIFTVAVGCASVPVFSMVCIHDIASIVTIGALCGFFAGFIFALTGPLVSVLTNDMSELAMTFAGLGALIGPPIDGLLLTEEFIWWKPAVFSGVMVLASFGCFLGMIFSHRRNAVDLVSQ